MEDVGATGRNGIAIDVVDWATTAEVAQRLAASYDDWWLPNDENRLGDVTWLVFEYADDGGIRSWSGPVVLDGTADPTLSCADIDGVVLLSLDSTGFRATTSDGVTLASAGP